jgi:hypothetical protein
VPPGVLAVFVAALVFLRRESWAAETASAPAAKRLATQNL